MNTSEFSNYFDTLANSYSETGGVSFDEYEKSVFLTKAQEDTIVSLYGGKNYFGESFEQTEELRRYLSSLIETVIITNSSDNAGDTFEDRKIIEGSHVYKLPDNNVVWFITYESANLKKPKKDSPNDYIDLKDVAVIPTTQDEYHRIKNNPFRRANDFRVLRLDNGKRENEEYVELISKYPIDSYLIRYLKKPSPIVLANFDNTDVSINGVTTITDCMLHPALHRVILETAVLQALKSRGINIKNK